MSNITEAMLRLKPIDTWSTREKLALATYAQKNNDQNFSSSKGLKAFAETNRPDDWFSRKMCALQYREMIDMFENDQKDVPKRKRRDKGTKETSLDMIVKNLTEQRLAELQESIPKLIFEQCRIQAKLDKLKDPANRKELIEEAKKYIQEHKRIKEETEKEHQKWLEERDIKINNLMKQPIVVRQQPAKVLVKQEAIDIEPKVLPEQLPVTPVESIPKEVIPEVPEIKPVVEPEIVDTEMEETIKSESDDKTETSEDIVVEEPKIVEPESQESEVEVIEEVFDDKQSLTKPPETPTQVRPTRSHSKATPEPAEEIFTEDDEQSQTSTIDSSIGEAPTENSKTPKDTEKSDTKFNKRAAIKVLQALQNHRFASLISSPIASKVGKEMIVKKIDIPQIKRKIENDQINSHDEFSKSLMLVFLGALYSNNIDWSSPDYSKIINMQHEIMDMITGEEKHSGQRSKRT